MSIGMGVTTTYRVNNANLNDLNGAIKQTVSVVKPLNVLRFGVINNNATAIPTAVVLTLKYRAVAGDASSDVTIATLSPSATVPRGQGLYVNVVGDTSPAAGEAPGGVQANPGGELVIELTTQAGGAQTGHLFVEAVEQPFQHTSYDADEDRLANMSEA